MAPGARIVLIVAALLCGGFITFLGNSLALALEADYTPVVFAEWLGVGALLSAPLWVPAVVPDRFAGLLEFCRRLGAVALLLPIYLFGTVAARNIPLSVLLTGLCVTCFVLLLWPDVRARLRPHPSPGPRRGKEM